MGPFIKSKNKTSKIMINLLVALLPIILFTFYKNGYLVYKNGYTNFLGMFYPLLFILVGGLSSLLIEEVYTYIFTKKRGKELLDSVINSYAFIPGLFISLVLPINTPLTILFIACLVAIIVGKMLFGGFGNNIFNPALVGCVFVIACFGTTISQFGGYLNSYEVDAISKATPLTNVSLVEGIGTYETLVKPYGSLWDFLIGTIPGAVGETSALLCIIAFIYLSLTKTIKWRIPITYVGTVFLISYIIALFSNIGIWYPLFQILSGGLLFGSVFMATDPVTSPVNKEGQVLYGILLGIITVSLRHLTLYPEGVLTSILLMNMFVFMIDRWAVKARFNKIRYFITIILAILVAIGMGYYISTTYTRKVDENDINFDIISKEVVDNVTTYQVSQKGFGGKIKAKIIFREGVLSEIEILEHSESEDRYKLVEDANYLSTLKKKQDNLEEVDTISSATITSTALKKMIINTKKDYDKNTPEVKKDDTPKKYMTIVSKKELPKATLYNVNVDSFGGVLNMEITVFEGDIKTIKPISYSDTCMSRKDGNPYYKCPEYMDEGYINNLLRNQNNVDSVDTVSGATISSTALKMTVKELKEGIK